MSAKKVPFGQSASVVFDLETSGLPDRRGYDSYYPPSDTKHYDKARIVSLGYILCDEKNQEISACVDIIKPAGFTITNDRFHHIPHKKAVEEGKDLKEVLLNFLEAVQPCDTMIAHNAAFDYNILLAECYRLGIPVENLLGKTLYCTMKEAKRKFRLRKVPKLTELFSKLFPDKTWVQQHEALDDARACLACYAKMEAA